MSRFHSGAEAFGPDPVRRTVFFYSDMEVPRFQRGAPGPEHRNGRNGPRGDPRADTTELSDRRIADLRRWIEAGGHDAPPVVDEVARRFLESGDLS